MTTVEILRAAKERLARPGVWVNACPEGDHDCVTTACANVTGASTNWGEAVHILDEIAVRAGFPYKGGPNSRPAARWNDAPGRTLEEVMAIFDEAIEIAEERQ